MQDDPENVAVDESGFEDDVFRCDLVLIFFGFGDLAPRLGSAGQHFATDTAGDAERAVMGEPGEQAGRRVIA